MEYSVEVSAGGDIERVDASQPAAAAPASGGESMPSPLAGNIVRVNATVGDRVADLYRLRGAGGEIIKITAGIKGDGTVGINRYCALSISD